MGTCTSKLGDSKISSETNKYMTDTRRSATESKVFQALLKKRMENATSNKVISFEKILLKFDKLRVVLGYVKTAFNELAKNEKLDFDGLKQVMKRMDINMDAQEVADLFDFVNVQDSKQVTIKEFLTALTISMVLDAIPALQAPEPSVHGEAPPKPVMKRSISGFLGHNGEIKEMLNLIVSAYLIFDPDGKGFIEKDGVQRMLQEQGGKGSNAMLSQQRWDEMVKLLAN